METKETLVKRIEKLEANIKELGSRVASLEEEMALRPRPIEKHRTTEADVWPLRESLTPDQAAMYRPRKD